MTRNRLRRALRLVALAIGAVACVAGAAALAIQFGIHLTNEWQQFTPLPAASAPKKGDRVVVFAPHSDDETLGCAGMLALAVRNGVRVRVVLMTNGDGFRIGVARAYTTVQVTPQKCIEYAYRRQQETLAALSVLGVPRKDVVFLGYPDRGIAALWDRYWGDEELYTSHATQSDHSPYSDSFTLHAPYCGEQLVADIERVLKLDQPTDVYVPHPCDNHSDHYATYCFVTAAIEQLRSEGVRFASGIKVHTYLVHRGDWPAPKGDHPREPLAPPFALANGSTKWRSLELGAEVAGLKREAIRKYRTQTALERGFLTSFARANEIFGDLPIRRVSRVSVGRIVIDGFPEDWWGIPPGVVDPVGDYVVAGMNKGGDVRAIYACKDSRYLYIRLDCVRRLSKRISYVLGFRSVGDKEDDDSRVVTIRPPSHCDRPDVRWAIQGNTLEMALPLSAFQKDDTLFVRVQTRISRLMVDNTGWQSLELSKSHRPPADG